MRVTRSITFVAFVLAALATLGMVTCATRQADGQRRGAPAPDGYVLATDDGAVLRRAAAIWRRQEREAWQKLQSMKPGDGCNCGESFEYIEARARWADIGMARSYFERMGREGFK